MTKNDFPYLVKGLRSANNIYLFDFTLEIILDEAENVCKENPSLIQVYTSLLVEICFRKGLVAERIMERAKVIQ